MTPIEQLIEVFKQRSANAVFYKEDIIALLELSLAMERLNIEAAELRGKMNVVKEINTPKN